MNDDGRRLATAAGGTAGGDGLSDDDRERLADALGNDADLLALAGAGDSDDESTDERTEHVGALAEVCDGFDYDDLADADPQVVTHLAETVREHDALAERYNRLAAMHREADSRSADLPGEPDDWAERDLLAKTESLAERLQAANADPRDGGDPYGDDDSIGGMFADGGIAADVDGIGALTAELDSEGRDLPNFSAMVADDRVPQMQTTLDHLVSDVPLHSMPPTVRAAVRSVRGGTDPDGSAFAFLQAVTLDAEEYADRAAERQPERARERRAGANYAGRGMPRSRADSDDDALPGGVLSTLDERDRDADAAE